MGFLSFIAKYNFIGIVLMLAGVVLLIRRRSLMDVSDDVTDKHTPLLIAGFAVMAVGIIVLCSPVIFEIAGIKLT